MHYPQCLRWETPSDVLGRVSSTSVTILTSLSGAGHIRILPTLHQRSVDPELILSTILLLSFMYFAFIVGLPLSICVD